MENSSNKDMGEALNAIASMMERSEKAQAKFAQGTSQHTLQKNRIKALYIVSSLIKKETEHDMSDKFTKEELEKALAPITSLISKSEKAQKKLMKGTWQHTMLGNNLKALYIALPLLEKALSEVDTN